MASSFTASPPGRRDRQKLERERRILRSAERLFARNGFAATAMENVATGAKLAVGTIYNYFPSKTDLLLAIIGRETNSVLRRGREVVDDAGSEPLAAIIALTDLFVDDLLSGDRRLWRELMAAAITNPSTIGARMFEADTQLIALLAESIERFKAAGTFAENLDASRAAIVIYSICFSLLTAYLIDDRLSAEVIRGEIHRAIAIAIEGLRPSPTGAHTSEGERGK
jgi:AcrR family transcriptional regulator